MVTDPDSSALLSTCAGAGATLVAIVGGLLVTRYVTLESELGAVRKLVKDLTGKLADADLNREKAQHELDEFCVLEALEDDQVMGRFLDAARKGQQLSAADLNNLTDLTVFEPKVVGDALMLFSNEATRVIAFDWDLVPYSNNHDYWSDFRTQHRIQPRVDVMWENAYIEQCQARPGQNRQFGAAMDMATMAIVSVPEQNARRDRLNRLTDARDRSGYTFRSLKAELAAATAARNSRERPPGLLAGLLVLAYLTVTSVVIPVLHLAPTPATLSSRETVMVVGLFLSGVALLFGYMGLHVYRLLDAEPESNPDTGADAL